MNFNIHSQIMMKPFPYILSKLEVQKELPYTKKALIKYLLITMKRLKHYNRFKLN